MPARRTCVIVGSSMAAAVVIAIIVVLSITANSGISSSGVVATRLSESDTKSSSLAWTEGRLLPTSRTEVAGAAVDGKIYIIGGFDRTGKVVPTVEVYDPGTDKWNTAAPLPHPLHHAAAASYNGTLYVVGGYLEDNTPSDKLLAYDPKTDEWRQDDLAPMLTARGALAASFVNGTLYAVGGVNASFGSPAAGPLATNEAYDPKTNSWSQKAPMPTPRQHLAAAVLDGKLYAIGGRIDSLASNLGSNEAYDPKSDAWIRLEPMPTKRGGIAAAAVGNAIYVFGDESPEGTFRNNEKYDTETSSWTRAPEMPTARHGLAAVALGDKIYVIGGGPQPGLTVSGANEIFSSVT
jgi:N-acetylneuraminic acid mutarotase